MEEGWHDNDSGMTTLAVILVSDSRSEDLRGPGSGGDADDDDGDGDGSYDDDNYDGYNSW